MVAATSDSDPIGALANQTTALMNKLDNTMIEKAVEVKGQNSVEDVNYKN